jgi:C-terminal processing protease CtpA/Prc
MRLPVALVAVALLPLSSAEVCAQAAEVPQTSAPASAAPEHKEPIPTAAPTTPISRREAVDGLSEADLNALIPLLKEHYITPQQLTPIEISRATVQGLLDRLAAGAAILPAPVAERAAVSPFRAEIIDNRIGYLRLGSVTASNISELDAALNTFTGKPLAAVVLDLRATPSGSDFEQAAEVCKRFSPKGKVLFTVRKPIAQQELILTSKDEPRFQGLLVVLVDSDTAGAAEVIAATLRAHSGAMVIGQKTKGEAVEFAGVPLPSGKLLRIAVAEVTLPEETNIFPAGLTPDLVVDVPQEVTDALLKEALDGGVTQLVMETERPRMNEAALVAGTNPELDAMQAAQERARGEKPKLPPKDAVLQRALDLVTTISIYQKKPVKK